MSIEHRSNGDALDLVLDILSAGLTPFSAQLSPTSSSSSSATPVPSFSSTSRLPSTLQPPIVPPSTPSSGDYDASSTAHGPPVSNQTARFHTLPHPPTAAGSTSSSLLKHPVSSPPPRLNSHSSLPRNFMPQSKCGGNDDLINGMDSPFSFSPFLVIISKVTLLILQLSIKCILLSFIPLIYIPDRVCLVLDSIYSKKKKSLKKTTEPRLPGKALRK